MMFEVPWGRWIDQKSIRSRSKKAVNMGRHLGIDISSVLVDWEGGGKIDLGISRCASIWIARWSPRTGGFLARRGLCTFVHAKWHGLAWDADVSRAARGKIEHTGSVHTMACHKLLVAVFLMIIDGSSLIDPQHQLHGILESTKKWPGDWPRIPIWWWLYTSRSWSWWPG